MEPREFEEVFYEECTSAAYAAVGSIWGAFDSVVEAHFEDDNFKAVMRAAYDQGLL